MSIGSRASDAIAKILPPTLKTDAVGPNGYSSTAPGIWRQCDRSSPAVTAPNSLSECVRGGPEAAPHVTVCSAPVWPVGGWLPCSCFGRMMQVHGKVGLAEHWCPPNRVIKHEFGGVEILARQPKPHPARPASVLAVAAN